jgi:ABC-type dipeptide/oligopeptide/nickel transport system ATPase component
LPWRCRASRILLIADEPTTALDVTIQAQILELIKRLKAETGASVILITHDLGIVAGMTDQVIVMYAGKIFERAPTAELFQHPGNPYTRGLLRSFRIQLTNRANSIRFRDSLLTWRVCRLVVPLRRVANAPRRFAAGSFRRLCS